MTVEEQLEQEYRDAPEQEAMPRQEFDRICNLSSDDLLKLKPSLRARFYSTGKYYAGLRQATSWEGMVVGGKTAEEILKSLPVEPAS
jgi:hypothetical protein